MGPLVFLTLAEGQSGEYDAIFSVADNPIYDLEQYTHYRSDGEFYNYTAVAEKNPDINLAPRKQLAVFGFCNSTNLDLCTYGAHLTLL